jgi:hypothetical protein
MISTITPIAFFKLFMWFSKIKVPPCPCLQKVLIFLADHPNHPITPKLKVLI